MPRRLWLLPTSSYHTEIEGNDLMSVSQVKHKHYVQNLAVHHQEFVWELLEKCKKTDLNLTVLKCERTD
jgi:hypothetical protein